MNAFILQESLIRRYNTYLTDLRSKITSRTKPGSVCSYYNHLSSRPVGHSMHESLKLKLQHAVKKAYFADAETPALFVGGRRRNRKRRKNKNGQSKRRNQKGPDKPLSSATPDFEYVQDYSPKNPVVTCVDIEEPVFIYEPISNKQTLVTGHDTDSLYNSNESLETSKERHDSGCELKEGSDDESDTDESSDELLGNASKKPCFPRTRSQDSGVDDDSFEVVSLDDYIFDPDSSKDVVFEKEQNTNNLKQELEEAENVASTDEISDNGDFQEVDLTESREITDEHQPFGGQTEVKIITDLNHIADHQNFLNLTEDEDDIIFDITQLELNTAHDNISHFKKDSFQLIATKGSNNVPTVLEEEALPSRFPMDLLIDDDKDDQVLFDAHARKELSITCNPLYEQSLKDEEERLSIKSFQGGFQTNFDNVNYIQVSSHASSESSRLLRSQKRDDEMACCVIL